LNEAAFGVIPAQQRLDAADLSGGQVDLELVHQSEFVTFESAAQADLQTLPFQDSRLHLRAKELAVIVAQFFSFVHGGVGAVDERFRVRPVV
jgi:hypothetical protein